MRRSVAAHLVVAGCLLGTMVGCASGSGAQKNQTVQGQPPPPEEANEPAVRVGPKVDVESIAPSEGASQETVDQQEARPADGVTVTRSRVQTLMEKGPAYILQSVTVEPARKEGSFVGYEIVGMTEAASRVASPQLAVGDVIETINGTEMQRPDDYVKTWKALNRVDQVVIEFTRDGKSEHAIWTIVDE